jgi:hypothetical protein
VIVAAFGYGAACGRAASCGFFDISCHAAHAIDSWFAGLVRSAVNPLSLGQHQR